MPRGIKQRNYATVISVAYSLGLNRAAFPLKIEKEKLSTQEMIKQFMQFEYDNFVRKQDIVPLYKRKCFSFRNFCRMFNLEPTLIQRYYKNPGVYQIELQYLKMILEALPDLAEIKPKIPEIYNAIKSQYPSISDFAQAYKNRGFHRRYLYDLFNNKIDLTLQRNFIKYINLMNLLQIPITLKTNPPNAQRIQALLENKKQKNLKNENA